MNENLNKPITVARIDFISALTEIINSSMLPAFVIEPILKEMYLETKAVAQKQYEVDKAAYEKVKIKERENINT